MSIKRSQNKTLPAIFYQSSSGKEPVREWLKKLDKEDRAVIGEDIKTVEFGWPVGMPVCRPMTGRKGLWEVRSNLAGGKIARILFFTYNKKMILLHGFVKKTQKTSDSDLDLAMKRKKECEDHGKK